LLHSFKITANLQIPENTMKINFVISVFLVVPGQSFVCWLQYRYLKALLLFSKKA